MIVRVRLASFRHGHRVRTGCVDRRGDLDINLPWGDDVSTPSDGRIGVVLPGWYRNADCRQKGVAGTRQRGSGLVHAVDVVGGAAALQAGIQMDVGIRRGDRTDSTVDGDPRVDESDISGTGRKLGFERGAQVEDVARWDRLAVEMGGEAYTFGTRGGAWRR